MLVGAVGGAIFVLVNAQSPLAGPVVGVLRVLACVAAASVLAMWFKAAREERRNPGTPEGRTMVNRGYVLVVVAEVILLFGGLQVLRALDQPAEMNVGWVALVVGVHFIALAPAWKTWSIAVPGTVLAMLGVAGILMVLAGSPAWVPFVSGVLSGVALLTLTVTYGWRTLSELTHR
ncbi:hypothetical protein GCM10009560_64790 [Nonomuraea longicatena]|uniref:Integral membrane protein n=1 Tax=Nonomuraea longicatena TaxID=83682 RepID=A0ABN1QV34_9ACTN